jgi:hypothetical protein
MLLRTLGSVAALAAALAAQPAGVPAGFRNVLVVRDVLPHLEAALASPRFTQLMRRSPTIRRELEAAGIPISAAPIMTRLYGRFVPKEIVLAAPDATLASLGRVFEIAVPALALGADGLDGDVRAEFAQSLAGHVAHLRELPLYLRVRARDVEQAETWLDQLLDLAATLPVRSAQKSADSGSRHEFTLVLGDLEAVRSLKQLGDWAEKLTGVRLAFTLRRDGDLLVLESGGGEGELARDAMHALWQDAPQQLLFAQVDWEPLRTAVERVADLLDQKADALEPLFERREDLRLAVEQVMAEVDPDASAAISVCSLDDGIEWVAHAEDEAYEDDEAAPAAPMAKGPLAMIGGSPGSFAIVDATLDMVLIGALVELRTRLLRTAVRAERRGGSGADVMDAADERLDAIAEFLWEVPAEIFEPGCGSLLEGASAVRALRVLGADGSTLATWEPAGLQVPAIALFGRIADADAAWQFADDLTSRLLQTLLPGPVGARLRPAELQLGVPTRDLGCTVPLSGGRTLHADGDLHPHWFLAHGTLVFSTSTALSRAMLARAKDEAAAPAADTVAWSRVTGKALCDGLRALVHTLAAFDAADAQPLRAALGLGPPPGNLEPKSLAILDEFLAWAEAIAEIDTRDRMAAGVYRSHTRLRWAQ